MAPGAVHFATAILDADVVGTYASDAAGDVLGNLWGEVVQVADAIGAKIEASDGVLGSWMNLAGIEASCAAQRVRRPPQFGGCTGSQSL